MADNKMIEALKALKEGCDKTPDCAECPIETFCGKQFLVNDPLNWDIPEVEDEPTSAEEPEPDEETSIVVVRKRLDALLNFTLILTEVAGCGDCPLNSLCKPGTICKDNFLAWLQGQPII